jgi:hypothetical protein
VYMVAFSWYKREGGQGGKEFAEMYLQLEKK